MDDYFYIVELPSFYGDIHDKDYKKATEDDLVKWIADSRAVVYRVPNIPMIIKADLHLERKGVKVDGEEEADKATNTTSTET